MSVGRGTQAIGLFCTSAPISRKLHRLFLSEELYHESFGHAKCVCLRNITIFAFYQLQSIRIMRIQKLWLATIAALWCNMMVSAHDLEVDGIYYNITSSTDLTAAVTYKGLYYDSDSNTYSGDVSIPPTITYNGKTYRVTSIGENAFKACSNLTTINIPEGVTSIGDQAFSVCENLAEITLSKSITTIGDGAFYACTSLTTINIPENSQLTNIGDYPFSCCTSLTTINIPEGVTSIGDDAFNFCYSLTTITIPESVTCIGDRAFNDCQSLTTITIPKGVTSIGDQAFSGCIGELILNCNTPSNPEAFKDSHFTKVSIGEGVTSIGEGVFYWHSSLTDITISESVTSIGEGAFFNCLNLTTINIPQNSRLTTIGKEAFFGCTNLISITIPESVTSIGENAFKACTGELTVNCDIPSSSYCGAFGSSQFTKVIIGKNVTSIGDSAFEFCYNLTSITIPEGVTSIGERAFQSCTSLPEINLPASVTSIGNYAFSSCTSLATINISENSQLTNIGKSTFSFCTNLTSITLPKGLTSIGERAFADCSKLSSINIPESVKSIDNEAFSSCNSLTAIRISSIEAWCNIIFSTYNANPIYYAKNLYLNGEQVTALTIPEGVKNIRGYAFYGFRSLTTLIIPENVTSIENSAFVYCNSLKEITLGKGLKKIASGSFTGCSSIKKVTIHAAIPPTTDGYIFPNAVYENAMLYVPQGSIAKYQVMTGWSGFYNISEIEGGTPDYLTIKQADNGEVGIAVDLGRTYKVRIAASDGWKVHSVTFNGVDMMAQLSADNTFTTPTLTGSAVLNVAYEQVSNKVDAVSSQAIKVRGHEGTLFVSGTDMGDRIAIYTADGATVTNTYAKGTDVQIALPEGVLYIVQVADKVVKIQL